MTLIGAVLLYIVILVFLSWLGYKRTHSTTDYLLGGRNTHPLIMALSYGATFISTSAIIGFGGLAANIGFSILWLVFLNVIIGVFVAFVFFGKRTRRLGLELDAHTFPELIGKRFNSRMLQVAAGIMIFMCMPIYAAAIIKGGVNFMETYFGISYNTCLLIFVTIVALYVLIGGFKAVMYTDALQGMIMFIAMLMLAIFTYSKLGGISEAHLKLTRLFEEPEVARETAAMAAIGFKGWTSMPAFASPMWWSLISSVLGAVGFGVLAQPQLIVRFMTVSGTKQLNRAVFSGGVFILVMTGSAYVVGALSNVLIFNDMGVISRVAAGGVSDKIIPFFITMYMPNWYTVLFMVAMLAAAMSTLSAQFHTMGSALGRDVGSVLFPEHSKGVAINRYAMVVTILLSLLLAWMAKYIDVGEAVIAKGTIIFFEMTICAFMPVYFGTLFSKKMPKVAAEVGMIAGFSVWVIWTFFLANYASVFRLCKTLTGKDFLLQNTALEPLAAVGASIPGLIISVLVIALVWIRHNAKAGVR